MAFRLAGAGATLYAKPDTASAALRQLPGGALITVLGTEGDFLRVITAGDRFGYVPSSASMTPAELRTAAIPATSPQAPYPESEALAQPDLPQPADLLGSGRQERQDDNPWYFSWTFVKSAGLAIAVLIGIIGIAFLAVLFWVAAQVCPGSSACFLP